MNSKKVLKNVKVFLETIDGKKMPSKYCEIVEEKTKCVATSNSRGLFSFDHVPFGDYKLSFKNNNSDGVIYTPPIHHLTHSEKPEHKQHKIELDGTLPKVEGKILNTLNNGIEGINIFLDGVEKTRTDSNGKFSLSNISLGEFLLEAHHENYFIKPINFNVNSSSTIHNTIEIIIAKFVNLCGFIDFSSDEEEESKNYQIKLH